VAYAAERMRYIRRTCSRQSNGSSDEQEADEKQVRIDNAAVCELLFRHPLLLSAVSAVLRHDPTSVTPATALFPSSPSSSLASESSSCVNDARELDSSVLRHSPQTAAGSKRKHISPLASTSSARLHSSDSAATAAAASVFLFNEQYVCKPAHRPSARFGWHTDAAEQLALFDGQTIKRGYESVVLRVKRLVLNKLLDTRHFRAEMYVKLLVAVEETSYTPLFRYLLQHHGSSITIPQQPTDAAWTIIVQHVAVHEFVTAATPDVLIQLVNCYHQRTRLPVGIEQYLLKVFASGRSPLNLHAFIRYMQRYPAAFSIEQVDTALTDCVQSVLSADDAVGFYALLLHRLQVQSDMLSQQVVDMLSSILDHRNHTEIDPKFMATFDTGTQYMVQAVWRSLVAGRSAEDISGICACIARRVLSLPDVELLNWLLREGGSLWWKRVLPSAHGLLRALTDGEAADHILDAVMKHFQLRPANVRAQLLTRSLDPTRDDDCSILALLFQKVDAFVAQPKRLRSVRHAFIHLLLAGVPLTAMRGAGGRTISPLVYMCTCPAARLQHRIFFIKTLLLFLPSSNIRDTLDQASVCLLPEAEALVKPFVNAEADAARIRQDPISGPPRGRLNLLSLDGGGIRGLVLVECLSVLEQFSGVPTAEAFRFYAGTSTGGLLAAALGARKFKTDECRRLYFRLAKPLFNTPKPHSINALEQAIRDVFGESSSELPLSQTPSLVQQPQPTRSRVMITSVNVTSSRECHSLHLFRRYTAEMQLADHAAELTDSLLRDVSHRNVHLTDDIPLRSALLATSAAPVFFTAHDHGPHLFVDGGLVIGQQSVSSRSGGVDVFGT
jgi:hypothetical protein